MNQSTKQLDYQTLQTLLELLLSHMSSNSRGESGNINNVDIDIKTINNF